MISLDILDRFLKFQHFGGRTNLGHLSDDNFLKTAKFFRPPVSKELLTGGPPVSKELLTGGPPVNNCILYKNDDNTIISNKAFGDISTTNTVNTTVCQVQKDILTFHTQLRILLTYAKQIH